ncbi:hypothetical protein H7Q97_01520 [Ochrobactrum sp. CM-21-5]|nr:hypothetical protein [Ochrobactrum sp. CM-21-5]MBC2884076.1 hypothetical protein [Ochrobactrum sp. CM-21-5]
MTGKKLASENVLNPKALFRWHPILQHCNVAVQAPGRQKYADPRLALCGVASLKSEHK